MHVGEQIQVVRHNQGARLQRRLQPLQHGQVKLLPPSRKRSVTPWATSLRVSSASPSRKSSGSRMPTNSY